MKGYTGRQEIWSLVVASSRIRALIADRGGGDIISENLFRLAANVKQEVEGDRERNFCCFAPNNAA